MNKALLFLLYGTTVLTARAGNEPRKDFWCITHEHDGQQARKLGIDLKDNPLLLSYEAWMREYTTLHYGEPVQRNRTAIYVIPVVFHIVHAGGTENISDAQVYDALNILNRDYNKLNADTASVINAFKSLVADVQIEFRLAQKDALGNCVKGITRTYSTETFIGTDAMVDDVNRNLNGSSNANNVRFPRNMYLNVWICSNPDGAAGYTTTPFIAAWDANHDGIWIKHSYFGSIGSSSVVTSRALTHEVGHWLNLSHVWGNTNNPGVSCGDDNVSDTPQTMGWMSCNLAGATCGNPVDNVQNYMEYSYCSNMFTLGQKARMHAALTSPIAGRNNLSTPSNLTATGTDGSNNLCAADFEGDKTILCQGDSVVFSDMSFHGVTSWNWTFTGGSPVSSTAQNPVVTYAAPGTYAVSLTVSDGTGNVSVTKNSYIHVLASPGTPYPYFESFEAYASLHGNNWYVENPDGQQAWEIYTGAGASGNKCVKLDNFSNTSDATKDAFVSGNLDLSGLPTVSLTFWMAYTSKTGSENDVLRVFISNNCGSNWVLKKSYTAAQMTTATASSSAFTPSGILQWNLYEITTIAQLYLTSDFRIKFELQSDLGNNVYIDDINLDGPVNVNEFPDGGYAFSVIPNPSSQAAVLQVTSPRTEKITIQITDISGRLIGEDQTVEVTTGTHSIPLPVNGLSNGMYMVHVVAGDMHTSCKLIKE